MSSEKKTILIFSEWYLPGYKAGGPITSLSNLIQLIGDHYSLKVICSDRDYMQVNPYDNIVLNQWQKVGKAEVMYLAPNNRKLSDIKSLIGRTSPQFIYLNGMFSKVFTLYPLMVKNEKNTEIILAPRGMLAPAALQIKSKKKWIFLKMAKLLRLYAKVSFHATNQLEFEQTKGQFRSNEIHILENIPNHLAGKKENRAFLKTKDNLNLYMVSRIAPEKNVLFALKCLHGIDSDLHLNLKIIGAVYNKEYFESCQEVVKALPPNIEVNFLGAKNQKGILSVAHQSDFFYLPTAGENYGHAIVEALLLSIPVIISDKTPWRDLEHRNLGFDLRLEENLFSSLLNNLGALSNSDYKKTYENMDVEVTQMININNLRNGYLNLFNERS